MPKDEIELDLFSNQLPPSKHMSRILNKFDLTRKALTTVYQPKPILTAQEKAAIEALAFFNSRKMVKRGIVEKEPVLYSSNSMKKLLVNDSTRLESHN
jgi:hypothetical protein